MTRRTFVVRVLTLNVLSGVVLALGFVFWGLSWNRAGLTAGWCVVGANVAYGGWLLRRRLRR